MNDLLLKNNYLIIENFIDEVRSKELGEEFRKYCEVMNCHSDSLCPSSPAQYNYSPFLEILCQKTNNISNIIGETVVPTYSYARTYYKDHGFVAHTDRPECEISVTLHLHADKDWPIFILDPDKNERSVILKPGDAMLYLGTIAPHWRNNYDGEFYTQTFFHYVLSRGKNAYLYFDNKNPIYADKISRSLDYGFNIDSFDQEKKNIIQLDVRPSNKIEDYIHVFDNIISEDDCDCILEEYENCQEWQDTLIGTEDGYIDKSIRNCKQISLSDNGVISNNMEVRKKIDLTIFEATQNVVNNYCNLHSDFFIEIDTGYNLLKYIEGGFYTQHVDSMKREQRSLSCSIILNDNYTGGEFGFFDRQIVKKPKKGSAIVFPSNFMYPHEIMPVLSGTRYSIITWFV